MSAKKFSTRALTSLLSAASFLVMGISGLIAYLMPHGRVAYWSDWRFIGLSKDQWGDMHVISSIVFLVAAGFHIYFNWRPLISYLREKAAQGMRLKKELTVALLAMIWIVLAGIYPHPPLGWLVDFGAYLKDSWVTSPAHEPPFGHAEDVSLATLCRRMSIPLDKALARLAESGYKDLDPRKKVLELAQERGTTPQQLFAPIASLEVRKTPAGTPARKFTAQEVEEHFAGTGIGRKTLVDIAKQTGQDPARMRERLAAAGLNMEPDESLKKAADRAGITPLEMIKVMLVDKNQ